MNTKPNPQPTQACEFDALRARMRRCVRKSHRRAPRMAGIEVAYVALADWIALVAESEQS
jgi:hypothetical protein